jgi:HlyD family secretion protein
MEVADLNHMRLVARVDETSIAGVKVGQRAKIRIHAYADEEFDGVVETVGLASTTDSANQRQVSSSADQAKFYEAKIHIQTNGRRILSGLNGDAEIETQRHDNVVKVPSQAVLGRPVDGLPKEVRDLPEVDKEKTYATVVYRYLNGKAVVTPVKVGPSDLTHTIIVSGLKEGDPVIVGPYKVLESIQHDQVVNDEKNAPTTQPTQKGGTAVAAG